MLDNSFSLDDYNWLVRARYTEGAAAFVFTPEPGQALAPVARGGFLLLHCIGGLDPVAYRLGLLAIHMTNGFLVYRAGTIIRIDIKVKDGK